VEELQTVMIATDRLVLVGVPWRADHKKLWIDVSISLVGHQRDILGIFWSDRRVCEAELTLHPYCK
jgi:hypothetical protein